MQLENEKLRLKVQHYEGLHPEVLTFVETSLNFVELEKKIQEYPLRTKRLIKKELLRIEVAQTKGLKDKIDFIVNAIEQTGEIIDDFFDEDPVWSAFQFNISTQTESNTEDRAVNTVPTRTADAHSGTHAHEHAVLGLVDTVLLSVVPPKKKRENFR